MPENVAMHALSNEPASSEPAPAALSGAAGAIPCGTVEELGTAMRQFTESLHQKGATVVSWINTVELMATDRSKLLLSSILDCSHLAVVIAVLLVVVHRFVADMKAVLNSLEGCFESLAECQHNIAMNEKPLEELLGFFLRSKCLKKNPVFQPASTVIPGCKQKQTQQREKLVSRTWAIFT